MRMYQWATIMTAALALAGNSTAQTSRDRTRARKQPVATEKITDVQPQSTQESKDENRGWRLSATPYAWLTSTKSDIRAKNFEVDSTVKFSDAVEMVNYTFIGNLEMRKDRFGIITDTVALGISEGGDLDRKVTFRRGGSLEGKVRADLSQDLLVQELKGAYRILDRPINEEKKSRVAFDLLAGVRYFYQDTDVQVKSTVTAAGPEGANRTRSERRRYGNTTDFMDPLVGARAILDVNERLSLQAVGDVGGFGVGSDSSASAAAYAKLRLTRNLSGVLGYKVLDVDYSGSGDTGFRNTYYGPIMGLNYEVQF